MNIKVTKELGGRAFIEGDTQKVKALAERKIKRDDFFYSYIRRGMIIYNWDDHKHLFEPSDEENTETRSE